MKMRPADYFFAISIKTRKNELSKLHFVNHISTYREMVDSFNKHDFIRLRKTSPHPGADDYVFYSVTVTDGSVPLSWTVVRRGFRNYLVAAGISREEQRERNISFHSFRHTFITLARSVGISDAAVMAMAGHRSVEMLAHYSHVGKILDFRELSERLGKMGQKEEKNS